VRALDLAVFADALAGEADALAARIERTRGLLRLAEIEREAATDLPAATVERLRTLGCLRGADERALRCAIDSWTPQLEALEELQAWVEERLACTAEPRVGS
jgi:hypothetical protein